MRTKTLFTIVVTLMIFSSLEGQRRKKEEQNDPSRTQPKLIVGIIVDQMRYDYLTRFWSDYGNGGFKRLVAEGFNCKNHHFNYAPTSTGPGHTSVYTGTTPSIHGIIGNTWYDKELGQEVYCASDEAYTTVGSSSDAGQMSPHRMLVTTITDQNRLHTQMRGKTIAVALKDRGAVLPGGHTANGAYWFEGGDKGYWVTSSYYMDELPKWVSDFNTSGTVETYKKPWSLLRAEQVYSASGADDTNYEGKFNGEQHTAFPHDLPMLWDENGKSGLLRITPFGNNLTTDFALAALEGENLGEDDFTDFLAISYSSTDYVGHFFGVNSREVQDTYLRLDLDLERLLNQLDTKVGEGNYTVFLTADHGAVHVPAFLADQKIPAGYVEMGALKNEFNEFLTYKYGTTDLVENMSNNQVFLDREVIENLDMDLDDVQEEIAFELLKYTQVDKVYTGFQMWQNEYTHGLPYILQNGWNQKRSGDVLFVQRPGFISYSKTGSTHGSPMIYDTHVPLLFYGHGIRPGETAQRTEIPDIAPTLAVLLGTAFPNGTTGRPITEVLD